MRRRNREISIFSMSALDLFASALGAFILLAIVIFPYFSNISRVEAPPPPVSLPPPPDPPDPSLRQRLEDVLAQLADARRELAAARDGAVGAEDLRSQLADVGERLIGSEERLAEVEADAAAAEEAIRRRLAEAEERLVHAEATARGVEEIRRRLADAEARGTTQFPHLDLVIALDVTGSMGEQIADLKQELDQLVQLLLSLTPSLGVGIVAFGDREWATPLFVFDSRELNASPANQSELRRFVDGMQIQMGRGRGATNNPDLPEAFLAALVAAGSMDWRTEAEYRVVVLITDNPAYPEEVETAITEAGAFAARGDGHRVSTVFVRTQGSQGSTESFLERVAMAGNGQFVRARGSFTAMLLLSLI